ncbi:MAG: hypothetical protein MJ025_06615 [Victivallaceae bacterium]|nr:hypothetical protein [Victivallaceae bacterium]
MAFQLRSAISTDIFDYLALSNALAEYSNVRTKIGRLPAAGEMVRIKNGCIAFPKRSGAHRRNLQSPHLRSELRQPRLRAVLPRFDTGTRGTDHLDDARQSEILPNPGRRVP